MLQSCRMLIVLVLTAFTGTPFVRAESIQKRPYKQVVYQYVEQTNPPRKIFVANVDLTSPDVQIRVSRGGPDPDGDGEFQTTLQAPTKIANREEFDIVVNGDFFHAKNTKDAEGTESKFVKGIWATVSGPAVTDGKLWGQQRRPGPRSLCVQETKSPSTPCRLRPLMRKRSLQVVTFF